MAKTELEMFCYNQNERMKEICRHPQASFRFLALRRQEQEAKRREGEAIRELELGSNGAIIFRRTIFDTEETIATAEDIKKRMELQARRYWRHFVNGPLTPQWRDYGRRHATEIARVLGKV